MSWAILSKHMLKRYTVFMKSLTALFSLLILFFVAPAISHAALLYTEVSGDQYGPGDTFVAEVRLDNQDECINVGRVVVSYPTHLVKAVDFSRGGSLFTLWVADPVLDTEKGEVVFEGGIPGGYCGRIQGDPALSNLLGKIIFTVVGASAPEAAIMPSLESELFISDGLGTKVPLEVSGAKVTVLSESIGAANAWIEEITSDTTPPDLFVVRVESTEGVFRGDYYAVFSTVDKQSGINHYEIFERGVWKRVESPYRLKDQRIAEPIQVRAIDKAGNERIGDFDPEAVPERKSKTNTTIFVVSVGVFFILAIGALYYDRRQRQKNHEVV